MLSFLGVFLGGGAGSVLRWLVCGKISAHWGTFAVNVLGAFFIGLAYAYFQRAADVHPAVKTLVLTGLLGGFTTFSTYLLDFSRLASGGRWEEAWLYLALSVAVGAGALVLGMKLAG